MSPTRLLSVMALAALCIASAFAADDKKDKVLIVDPAEAEKLPDFKVQGEYAGELGGRKWGAHVIALGGPEFDLVLYAGGLPGDGWPTKPGVREPKPVKINGKTEGGATSFKGEGFEAKIQGGGMTVSGKGSGTLKKVNRQSPTLGAKPPKGAIVLFDGSSADAFKNGKMTQGNLLLAGCETKQKFGSHRLHVEFRTPYKPYARGQGRGNSGVYIHNRYEVQVLDSFGLEGKENECGSIYSISRTDINMCYPPLTWQTYDIDFTAPQYDASGKKVKNGRATVRHNGVVIHDDLELPKQTPGKHKEGPEPDGFYLQGHGNPVVFRNVWLVPK